MRHKEISQEKTAGGAQSTIAACGPSVCARDVMQKDPEFLHLHSTIQQAMEAFRRRRMSSLLVVAENPLDESMSLLGRVCLKDVFGQIYMCLMQKDLINLNQVLHKSIENILIQSRNTVTPGSDAMELLSVMLTDFPYVTGVVENGRLVGQISCLGLLDLFKSVKGNDSPWTQFIRQAFSESSKVSGAMARHILCLSPQDEISKVMGILMATHTFSIPVLDEQGKLRRIISRMDVLEYILKLLEPKELGVFEQKGLILDRTVSSLDEKGFATISADSGLADATAIMIEKNVFCLAVTDIHRRFCGLLAFTDILNWVHTHLQGKPH
jgi:CBS-domain-containing membrane protein